MPTPQRIKKLRAVLERRQDDVEVVLDNIHDAHNASAILRSCDGFGIGAVGLLYTDHPFPKLSAAVSGFSAKWISIEKFHDAESCVAALHARGRRVYATALSPDSRSYLDVDWTDSAAIVLGNEHRGCTEELLALADERIQIPMHGMAHSFNVSVAAAIVLGELHRQRLDAGMYRPSWTDEKERLYRVWLKRERHPLAPDPYDDPADA